MLKLHETENHPLDAILWVSGCNLDSNRYIWIMLHNNLPTLFSMWVSIGIFHQWLHYQGCYNFIKFNHKFYLHLIEILYVCSQFIIL